MGVRFQRRLTLRVLEALAQCRPYRVLGLGHTANRTLAELVVDHAAATPTAAGVHVRQGIADAGRLTGTARQLRDLRQALEAKELELATERRAVRLEEVQEMPFPPEEAFRKAEKRPVPAALGWIAVGAAVAWAVLRWL